MKSINLSVIALLFVGTSSIAQAQPLGKEPKAVAIFLYQGVELLDFAGPGEVFTSGGFKVFTVSVDGQEVLSQGFVSIKPQYSVETCPDPDIIVFPGGNSGPSAGDARVMDWIAKRDKNGAFFMSVCTGAGILAKSGMLNSFKNVTTFHGYIPDLQKELPQVNVLSETRFVDNGRVITTAGVSAGIDGALYLVSRIKGLDVAKAAAHYMEYEKWNPDAGLVDRENELIKKLKAQSGTGNYAPIPANDVLWRDVPYAGEFNNLARELEAKGNLKGASFVLTEGIKAFPSNSILYRVLADVNFQLGKPGPMPENEVIKMMKEGKVEAALQRISSDTKKYPSWPLFDEDQLNLAGYYFLGKHEYSAAIQVLEYAVSLYPRSSNAYDSLGEAYLASGNKTAARTNYLKSLELDPKNENAKRVIANL